MKPIKILSRDHSATRFEIYQSDRSLCLRCHVCGFWLTDIEFNYGWIEFEGCKCAERRIEVNDMLRSSGIIVAKYDSSGEYRGQFIKFIKEVTAPHFPLDDLLDGQNVEDVPFLYQWIAFWTGNDVLGLELNFGTPR